MQRIRIHALAAAVLLALPGLVLAESTTLTPAASGDGTTASLDFKVIIPAVLYLRVGAGNAVGAADNATVNTLQYTVPAANIGDSSVINADALFQGDIVGGGVTVRVFSNVGGDVELKSTVSGQMQNANGDVIPWSEIDVTSANDPVAVAGYADGIAHPAFLDTGAAGDGLTPTTLANVGKLVRKKAKWTFSYLNSAVVPAGTYGTAANNGRVTYTATAQP